MIENVRCELCGHDDTEVIWDKTDRPDGSILIRTNEGKVINSVNVICKHCGLVYLNPRASEKTMTKFYEEKYRKSFKPDLAGEYSHASKAVSFLNSQKGHFPTKSYRNFLDIGCASGMLVDSFSKIGTDSYGIDQDKRVVEIGKEKGLNLINTTLDDYNPGIKFSLITILNTLEHLHSPKKALLKIKELLDDDGICLISVPDFFTAYLWCSSDGFMSSAHLYNFTARSLNDLCGLCGLRVLFATMSIEMNFAKVYVIVIKGEQKQPVFRTPDIEMIKTRLRCLDFVYNTYQKEINDVRNYLGCM